MSRKDKVQIYIPVGTDWKELVEEIVSLRSGEGKVYAPWYGMDYTTSEVVIDALQELARRIKQDNGKD